MLKVSTPFEEIIDEAPIRNSLHIVVLIEESNQYFILIEQSTFCQVPSLQLAPIILFSSYYVFNLAYSKQVQKILYFVHDYILGMPDALKWPGTYLAVASDINHAGGVKYKELKFSQIQSAQAGLSLPHTNHSLRAYGATKLFRENVPEKVIQDRTGHHSTDALRKYQCISEKQKLATSLILNSSALIPINSQRLAAQPTVTVQKTSSTKLQ